MGLMGNVAEVDHLKSHLMNFIPIFRDLLDSESDGIEVVVNDFVTSWFIPEFVVLSLFIVTFLNLQIRSATIPVASWLI